MTNKNVKAVLEQLSDAASQVQAAPNREPWDHGWYLEGYRRSEGAALTGTSGPVTMTSQGIAAFEVAVTSLLREGQVRDRWTTEEFWGTVASLVVAASEKTDGRAELLQRGVDYLRRAGRALTIQLVANAAWGRMPLSLGNAVMGDANMEFLAAVNSSARGRMQVSDELAERWLEREVKPRLDSNESVTPVAIACWTAGQGALAFEETERQLRNIVDLAILLEHDLQGHKILRRGDINRPGVRGLSLDRGAIDRNLRDSARIELAAFTWTITSRGVARPVHWYSAEPLPLGALLDQGYLREAVRASLKEDAIAKRLKVAARWFSEAHYTMADDDAALALGVAMDALLTGQRSLPGSAMADRLALLADNPAVRPKLVADYLEFYRVRSSVAHGGRSSRLDDPDFMNEFRSSVQWAAWRSLAMRDRFSISTEGQIDELYDDLRWGVRSWASSAEPASSIEPTDAASSAESVPPIRG